MIKHGYELRYEKIYFWCYFDWLDHIPNIDSAGDDFEIL